MLLGILSAILYLIVAGVYVTKHLKEGKIKKVFRKVHKPIGCVLIIVSLVHLITSLQLINQRPLIMYLLGLLMVVSQILSITVYKLRKRIKKAMTIHKFLALIMLICLCLHVFYGMKSFSDYQTKVDKISVSDIDLTNLADGIYQGEYDVGYIYAKVEVVIEDRKISGITILEHRNEQGKPGEEVIKRILQQQKINVDAVSGATNSSNVIKKAVENAVKQAVE